MKKSWFSEEQIIGVLKEVDSGWRWEMSAESTGSAIRLTIGGRPSTEAWKLVKRAGCGNWSENRRLKQMVADQALDIQALRTALARK